MVGMEIGQNIVAGDDDALLALSVGYPEIEVYIRVLLTVDAKRGSVEGTVDVAPVLGVGEGVVEVEVEAVVAMGGG